MGTDGQPQPETATHGSVTTPARDGVRRSRRAHARELLIGSIVAALLTTVAVAVVTQIWDRDLDRPFQYSLYRGDDQQDATLELMLVKNIHESGWFDTNPKLNAPFRQEWAEWPMGGDVLAYGLKKVIVDTTGNVPLTLNLFWLLTFPLVALIAYPSFRALRASPATALVGAVLYALAPYHFRNGTAHSNLAFYAAVPVIVIACMRLLAPPGVCPGIHDLRHRTGWRSLRWLLLGAVLVGITGIYYLAFLLTMLAACAVIGAIAYRRIDRVAIAALIGAAGFAASTVANWSTLQFRWSHAPNLLAVPERIRGTSDLYPLRIAELVGPITDHRFGPFATLASNLSPPGRQGLGTAQLGAIGAIGLVVGVAALVIRVVRHHAGSGWRFEARLGVVMLVAILLGMGGGVGRLLEHLGLQGVRAWPRIGIVIAFAALVVTLRLLDRARASLHLRNRNVPAGAWIAGLAALLVIGVWDQTPATALPAASASAAAWTRDQRFVDRLERAVPRGGSVFELPITDFPDNDERVEMSSHDLVKLGYLHSKDLRWSAGGIHGRSAEWQFPLDRMSARQLAPRLAAVGFDAILLDPSGYRRDQAQSKIDGFTRLLGPPVVTDDSRVLAWNLVAARDSLLAGRDPAAARRLARRTLTLPRLYSSTDVEPRVARGHETPACRTATLRLINLRKHPAPTDLTIRVDARQADPPTAAARIRGRWRPLMLDEPNRFTLRLPPGSTTVPIRLAVPNVRCDNVEFSSLPVVSAALTP